MEGGGGGGGRSGGGGRGEAGGGGGVGVNRDLAGVVVSTWGRVGRGVSCVC